VYLAHIGTPMPTNREDQQMSKTFTFHTDAGHGWIEVDWTDLKAASLNPSDFSRYSYRQRNTFYLEEDCDASKFIAAWQEQTGQHAEFRDAYMGRSFIRQLSAIHS
jgi:hypothetical protein